MQRVTGSLILVFCLLLSAAPAVAHHAFATEFDAKKPVTIKGIVTKIDWTNPHVWFYLNIKTESGLIENWGFEMGGPNGLRTQGWTKETVKFGMVIKVSGIPSRAAGSHGITNARLALPDGTPIGRATPEN